MSEPNFYKPQRQSPIGILLFFSAAVFQLIRNLWVLGVYFFVRDIKESIIIYSLWGFLLVLFLTLIYSVFSYLRFIFYIDEEKGEFVLEKGVFSSEVVSIPYNRIQQVNFKRNLLQRFMGVYSVVIDTAGSQDQEVEIKALSKQQADILSELLMKLSKKEEAADIPELTSDFPEEENAVPVEWEHRLSFFTLLKLGLTSNYFRGLAVLIAFYFTLREQFRFSEDLLPMPNLYLMEIASGFIMILLLVLLGMLITIGETFIKYYNLELKKTSAGLQLEMGLRENTRVTLRAERVQLLQVLTNPIQKRLDLFNLRVFLASSRDDLDKERIQIPGMPQEIVKKVEEYLYSSPVSEKQQIRPHRLGLIRRIMRGLIPLIITTGIILFSPYEVTMRWLVGLGFLYILLLFGYQILYFRSLKLSVSEEFLVKHSGVWIKKKQIIEIYKLQSVSLNQPLWYKKEQLGNLIFHTAGGDISFSFVNTSEAVALVDYLLYKIESSTKAWM